MWKGYKFGFICFLLLVIVSVFFIIGNINAQPPSNNSCISGNCHPKMGKDKFIHGPVAVAECKVCHKETGKHKFEQIKDVKGLCYECHDKVDTKKNAHKPVKEGNCTKCHNPHQSPNKYQLISAGSKLCLKCHSKNIVSSKFLHVPVAAGDCTMCHNAHQSDFPKMLQAEGNEACFLCHTDKKDDLSKKKFVHKPVKESCIKCHSPHSSNFKFQLKNESTSGICFDCHKEKKAAIEKVKVPHKALSLKGGCLECHNAHVSNFPKQLNKEPMDLCLSCHNREYKTGLGIIANIQQIITTGKIKHGPIKQKDCSSCHDPHGSDNFRILRNYFPPLFYASFDIKNYELCFTCHQKSLVLDSKTKTLTNFRNGEQNLHFVHVNKTEKGRTCRACHETHATSNPRHIRDSVPFGGWKIPINFKIKDNGGSCAPGCHSPYSYDRNSTVKNK